MTTDTAIEPSKNFEYLLYTRESNSLVPKVQRMPYTCTPDLTCTGMTTPLSDTNPIRGAGNWFHIEQIPHTMDKLGFTHAATLQKKWFAGESHKMQANEKAGDIAYDDNFIDTTTLTMAWLQSISRVRQKLSELISTKYLTTPAAQNALHKKLIRNGLLKNPEQAATPFTGTIPPINLLDGNVHPLTPWTGTMTQHYHLDWQFQRIIVDGTISEQIIRAIERTDDLYAAVGVFSLNAALSKAFIRLLPFNQLEVVITEIVVYARDTYDFNDGPHDDRNDRKSDAGYNTNSQYLGHWNRNGLMIVPLSAIFSNQPLVTAWPPTKDNTYFCVRDVHYRKWRDYHQQENDGKGYGGDLMIYSDAIKVPVSLLMIIPT